MRTLQAWILAAGAVAASSAYGVVIDKDDLGRKAIEADDIIRSAELLDDDKQRAIKQIQEYLGNDLKSLRKLNADSLKDPSLHRVLLELQKAQENLQHMDYKRPWGLGGAMAWGADAWAYHQNLVDPLSIHIMAKYWDLPPSVPGPEARLRQQIWYAERASILIHEMLHAGNVGVGPGTADSPKNPKERGIDWGTGENEAYTIQYLLLRMTVEKPLEELRQSLQRQVPGFKPDTVTSMLLVDVLEQLRNQGIIKIAGNMNDPAVWKQAMDLADKHVKDTIGLDVPPLLKDLEVRYIPDVPGWPPGQGPAQTAPGGQAGTPPTGQNPPTQPPGGKQPPPPAPTAKLPPGLPAPPASGAGAGEIDKWKNECLGKLDQMFNDDPDRKKNSEDFRKTIGWGQVQDLTCANTKKSCGVTKHWWLDDRWSCSGCETCIMPSQHPKAGPFVKRLEEIRKKYDDMKAQVTAYAEQLKKPSP